MCIRDSRHAHEFPPRPGGAFTTNGWNTVTLNYVARWNGTAWGALGVGFNSWVYSLTADAGGNVYAGGIFTQDSTNSVTFNRIAKWNGAAWSALGSGASEAIRDLLVQNGDLYAGGFSGRGIFQRWRSGSWTDLTPSQGNGVEAAVQAMLLDGSGNLFVGGRFFNAGLQTDRFEVEWWVTSHRAEARATRKWRPLRRETLLAGGALLVNEATFDAAGLPVPPPNYVSRPSNLMLVEIPANFQAIKRQEFALAQRWRAHTRDIFEGMFDSGFLVTDFVTQEDETGRPRSYYLLTHGDS